MPAIGPGFLPVTLVKDPVKAHYRARVDLKSATLPPDAFAQLFSAIIRNVLPDLRCTSPAKATWRPSRALFKRLSMVVIPFV